LSNKRFHVSHVQCTFAKFAKIPFGMYQLFLESILVDSGRLKIWKSPDEDSNQISQ